MMANSLIMMSGKVKYTIYLLMVKLMYINSNEHNYKQHGLRNK